jgi:hypothetical protein
VTAESISLGVCWFLVCHSTFWFEAVDNDTSIWVSFLIVDTINARKLRKLGYLLNLFDGFNSFRVIFDYFGSSWICLIVLSQIANKWFVYLLILWWSHNHTLSHWIIRLSIIYLNSSSIRVNCIVQII